MTTTKPVKSTIPTETLSGCVVRQLYHGLPYWVFVQHPRGTAPRAVFRVNKNGGGYGVIGPRMDWNGDATDDALCITAEYLNHILKHL